MDTEAAVRPRLLERCPQHVQTIGQSEGGRPILGLVFGRGSRRISLLAGSHADEPVGTLTIAFLADVFQADPESSVLSKYTFCLVPHTNPDGAAMNEKWIEQWPDPVACLRHIERELPGRDIEFGYPDLRDENRVVSAWLTEQGPFQLHASLHGMTLSEGGQLLIDRLWADRTEPLRRAYGAALTEAGLELFAYDRKGEKGFEYLGPGFASTPRGEAMRKHFEAAGDLETAKLFKDSSMEFVRSLGGDPLALVTELPLFVIRGRPEPPAEGVPTSFLKLRSLLPQLRYRASKGEDVSEDLAPFKLDPLDVTTAVRLQIHAINLGLEAIG
jgi:hypothetical protein